MPRIFDNLEPTSTLLTALQKTLELASRADFCVGYFNLRGWRGLAPCVDEWNKDDGPCRVLIGMQRLPHDDLREALSLVDRSSAVDSLNMQLRTGASDDQLAGLVIALREEDKFCVKDAAADDQEPQIICSLGLFAHAQNGLID